LTSRNDIAAKVLCAAGIDALARRQLRGQLAIFMFHGVEATPLSPACWHVIDAATLRRQLDFLHRHFALLPLEVALERLWAGDLPPRAAALTFDDGARNLATQAAPVLREFSAPAAAFVSTGPMGNRETLWADRLWLAFARTRETVIDLTAVGLGRRPLRTDAERADAYGAAVHRLKELSDESRIAEFTAIVERLGEQGDTDPGPFQLLSWDEARSLATDSKITMHPHTVTHPILSQCSDAKVRYEIAESCEAVEREIGCRPIGFAYPNGRLRDFDDRARDVLKGCGVQWALSTVDGFADRDSDRFALPRIGIGSDLTHARFRLLASGGQSSPKAHLAALLRRA
jgi:peptidoglycan/xylan/chitin deacetylase (PgdA/CDA1 family)